MSEIASFDIFDTVLTRKTGSPQALFLLLGRRLVRMGLINHSAESFARARIEAERRAGANLGFGRVTHQDIYRELQFAFRWSESAVARLMELECALEEELICPVPGAHQRIEEERAKGRRIMFISEMYLPSAFIRRQLEKYGLSRAADAVYVSCEEGLLKREGLFQKILQKEGVTAQAVHHVGNHRQADVDAPRRCGMKAHLFGEGNLNRYEQMLESHLWETEGVSSIMSAASRLARLSVPAATPQESVIRDVAASVVAPTLVSYVLWVLRRAQTLGLKRLYFVSRDGQILLGIAQRLLPKLNMPCELRYLYGSRYAWHFPAMTQATASQLDWIWYPTDHFSLETLLGRVRMQPQDISHVLKQGGFATQDSRTRHLKAHERVRLRRLLVHEKDFTRLVAEKAAQERRLILRYFEQERLFDAVPSGFIDVGWYGTLYDSLGRLVALRGARPPHGFYFGLLVRQQRTLNDTEGYLREHPFGMPVPHRWVTFAMEMFCAGDHPTVLGYQEREGRMVPIFAKPSQDDVVRWGLSMLRKVVDDFSRQLSLGFAHEAGDMRASIAKALQCFWFQPSLAEATTWGAFPWEDGVGDVCRRPLAQRYQWSDVLRVLRTQRVPMTRRIFWRPAALALTPRLLRVALQQSLDASLAIGRALSWFVRAAHLGAIKDVLLKPLKSNAASDGSATNS